MKRLRVGLNGFGRIGRAFMRIALKRNTFDIVAINTRKTAPSMMAYLLNYDSVYRRFDTPATASDAGLTIGSQTIACLQNAELEQIPWDQQQVDVVIDATGAFTTKEELIKHQKGTVKKVVLTAPAKGEMTTVVLGVNDDKIDWKNEVVISNASCTTNCAAPLFKVLQDNLKIVSGFLTTAHAYTMTQPLLDDAGKSEDRSRSAPLNIAPSTTGAAKAVVQVIPELSGKIDGMSIRIPVPTGSLSDISVVVEKSTTAEEINAMFQKAASETMKGLLQYETTKLVSSDYIGSPYSCIFDANYTKVMNGTFVKVFGWYDNEWGYSTRLVDVVEKIANYL